MPTVTAAEAAPAGSAWPQPAPRVLYVAEPPAMWHTRSPVVVDCSVLVACLFGEPQAEDAQALIIGKALHAPTLLPFELSNVARSKLRAGAPRAAVEDAMQEFADQRFQLHPAPPLALLALADSFDLSAYDAAYLWLAAELQAPLVTFDRRLAAAAQRHLGNIP